MEQFANIFDTIWSVIKVLICLNFVIFMHELGHFLAARWAGVRVERFAIGVGKAIWSWTPGETEYRLGCVPIMGYVMMAGQDDFDAEGSAHVEGEAYPKGDFRGASVFKRFVIIAAGVTMNIITAAVLFVIVGMAGIFFPTNEVGTVIGGTPAKTCEITWADGTTSKGFEPGDILRSINGTRVDSFFDLKFAVMLSDVSEKEMLTVGIRRTGRKGVGYAKLTPIYDEATGQPVAGVGPATTLEIVPAKDLKPLLKIGKGGTIVQLAAADGTGPKIDTTGWMAWKFTPSYLKANYPDLPLDGRALRVRMRRPGKDGKDEESDMEFHPQLYTKSKTVYLKDGKTIAGVIEAFDPEEETELAGNVDKDAKPDAETPKPITVKPGEFAVRTDGKLTVYPVESYLGAPQRDGIEFLGMRPRTRVAGVFTDSPADKAGVLPGDVVVRYGDTENPSFRQFNDISNTRKDKPTTMDVLRDGKRITLEVRPKTKKDRAVVGILLRDGFAAAPVVARVRKGSLADKAGIKPGWTIKTIDGQPIKNWNDVYRVLDAYSTFQGRPLCLDAPMWTLVDPTGKVQTVILKPYDKELESASLMLLPEVNLMPGKVLVKFDDPMTAMRWGAKQTYQQTMGAYASLRAIFKGTVSAKNASGIVGIVHVATGAAREGWMKLIYLMAIISVALAVFNFLPLPVVDGGHAVLLIIEGIRGKPLPEKIVVNIQRVGIYLILALFVVLTIKDIWRIYESIVG